MRAVVFMIAALLLIARPAFAAGDAAAGQSDFSRCNTCHSVEPGHNGIGPSLAGIVGRQAAQQQGYTYSPAMKAAHVTWDEATLDRFLSNPQGMVHGTKMFLNVPDPQQRQDIIAYLDTLR
jgi:cytochrome c2